MSNPTPEDLLDRKIVELTSKLRKANRDTKVAQRIAEELLCIVDNRLCPLCDLNYYGADCHCDTPELPWWRNK